MSEAPEDDRRLPLPRRGPGPQEPSEVVEGRGVPPSRRYGSVRRSWTPLVMGVGSESPRVPTPPLSSPEPVQGRERPGANEESCSVRAWSLRTPTVEVTPSQHSRPPTTLQRPPDPDPTDGPELPPPSLSLRGLRRSTHPSVLWAQTQEDPVTPRSWVQVESPVPFGNGRTRRDTTSQGQAGGEVKT